MQATLTISDPTVENRLRSDPDAGGVVGHTRARDHREIGRYWRHVAETEVRLEVGTSYPFDPESSVA